MSLTVGEQTFFCSIKLLQNTDLTHDNTPEVKTTGFYRNLIIIMISVKTRSTADADKPTRRV